jgi:hypothetical protein
VEIIHLHLIDVYARSKHPVAPRTRLETWQESAAEFPPALPGSPEDLVVLLAKTTERSLSVRGIELGGMFYSNDALMALRATMAANNLAMDKLTVRYNPWDLGTISVVDPVERRYLKVPAVDAAMQGMTEYQWRVMRRAVRDRFDNPDQVTSLAAARNTIRDAVDEAIHKPSRKRRKRAARFSGEFQSQGRLQEESTPSVEESFPPSTETNPQDERAVEIPDEGDVIDVDDWDVAF